MKIFNENSNFSIFDFPKNFRFFENFQWEFVFSKFRVLLEILQLFCFFELCVQILRRDRSGSETHESGVYHSIILPMRVPTLPNDWVFVQKSENMRISGENLQNIVIFGWTYFEIFRTWPRGISKNYKVRQKTPAIDVSRWVHVV